MFPLSYITSMLARHRCSRGLGFTVEGFIGSIEIHVFILSLLLYIFYIIVEIAYISYETKDTCDIARTERQAILKTKLEGSELTTKSPLEYLQNKES